MMEEKVIVDKFKQTVNMGADNTSNSTSRLITLQNRKHVLEENIALKNRDLRTLCIQEAELTGIMPPEVPLEPGEPFPPFRRRVGTAFEYPQNLINKLNNEEETVAALETRIQLHRRVLEDVSRLANGSSFVKEKRKNTIIYEQTKQLLKETEEKLQELKPQASEIQPTASHNQHLKHKKKPRPPLKSDTNSLRTSNVSPHIGEMNSGHNSNHTMPHRTDPSHHNLELEQERYMLNRGHVISRNTDTYSTERDMHRNSNYARPDDGAIPTSIRLSVNTYSGVKDRRGSGSSNNSSYHHPNVYGHTHSNPNIYQHQSSHNLPPNTHTVSPNTHTLPPNTRILPNSHTLPSNAHTLPPKTHSLPSNAHSLHSNSHTLPSNTHVMAPNAHTLTSNTHTLLSISHLSSPPSQYQTTAAVNQPNFNFPVQPHTLQYSSSRTRSYKEESRKHTTEMHQNGYIQNPYTYYSQHTLNLQTSPQSQKLYATESNSFPNMMHLNSVPLYQHCESDVLSMGLGGHWLKHENGESIWVPTGSHTDMSVNWQTDKRFGSLDRRKEKFSNKYTSPTLENVCINSNMRLLTNSQQESIRISTLKSVQNTTRSSSRQLVRTQSLGSVGVHTIDSVWPSDDNSSYDSDGYSINERNATSSRKSKPKGWCETSLDGPTAQNINLMNLGLFEGEQFSAVLPVPSRASLSSPQTPKPILEIPAESNPSLMYPETNVEIFNNNVLTDLPKNCTVIQAGQFKPYREVTKPFEMKDFYKYSTKFKERKQDKKVPCKVSNVEPNYQLNNFGTVKESQNLNKTLQESFENQDDTDGGGVVQKGIYQPLQPMKCQPFSPSHFNRSLASLNSPGSDGPNLDSSLALTTANVAEHFSAEMNEWYQNHRQVPLDNSNNTTTNTSSVGRSTATLV